MSQDKWSAADYNKNASFVYSAKFTSAVLDLLQAQPGERILDVGCGSGELTVDLQHVVGEKGLVVGIDSSASMIEKAHANGVSNCFVCDCQNIALEKGQENTFDAIFSNAALHWMSKDPAGVLRGVQKALKPGGRFVAEFGGFLNIVGIRGAIQEVLRKRGVDPKPLDPWYFPSVDEYKDLLESHSFRVEHISLNPRITPLPGRLYDWLVTFVRTPIFGSFDDQQAHELMEEVESICEIDQKDGRGNWALMYVRLRFRAILE